MSVGMVGKAWGVEVDSPVDRVVLLALSELANVNGYSDWPKRVLVEMTGYSEPTIRRSLHRLRARGVVEVSRGHSDGFGGATNVYRVVLP